MVWSIIGNSIPGSNWAVDSDMKYINDGKGTWKITTNMTPGAFKFRKNHDWGTNYGGNVAGALTGDDINITVAGNYTITLDIPNNKYILIKN